MMTFEVYKLGHGDWKKTTKVKGGKGGIQDYKAPQGWTIDSVTMFDQLATHVQIYLKKVSQ